MSGSGFLTMVTVAPEDIDDLGHANNVRYLAWMLQAAEGHWALYQRLADPEVIASVAWVVMRHELDYFLPAFAGDRLEVYTWVPTCTALTSNRYYEIVRAHDGALLARGYSSYCVIDRVSGKPRRLSEELRLAIGGPEVVKRIRDERWFPTRPIEIWRDPALPKDPA